MATLAQIKTHLKLEPADTSRDVELRLFIAAAIEYVESYTGVAITDEDGDLLDEVPFSITAAILLIVGDLDQNREGKIIGVSYSINPTVNNLLHFHRVGMGI